MFDIDQAKSLLDYYPEEGVFRRRVTRGNSKRGTIAGYRLDKGHSKLYWAIEIAGNKIYAHRLAFAFMTGEWPDEVDHIDGNGMNNKWSNLRGCSRSSNCKNRRLQSNNKSGILGVSWRGDCNRWVAKINSDNKQFSLYSGKDFLEACCARKRAENRFQFHPEHGTDRPL